jgi:SpoVK/Ycf46/Vps4 family AAA+-type ATPase
MTTSTDAYVKDLLLNVRANHPVTIVYTDDPNETLALTKAAMPTIRERTDKIYYWTARNRWTDITNKDKQLAELIASPVEVQLSEKQKKSPLQFAFSSPEELKGRNPVFILSLISSSFKDEQIGPLQELRDFDYMVRNGINDSYRIIVLANSSFTIPTDYENIFGVVRHLPPTKEELSSIYDEYFIHDFVEAVVSKVYEGGSPDDLKKIFVGLKDYCINTLNGLSSRQVKLILYKALSHAAEKTNKTTVKAIDVETFKEFIYDKKFEEISRTEVVSILKPISMDQVGGLNQLKGWLQERKWAFSEEAKNAKVDTPKGMCLIGPPGTGKTHIARATASMLDFPCLKFDASRVFNKYVGESEQRIKQTLELVEQMAPCVLFIDEIDKIFAGQAGGQQGDSGATSRVFGTLLSFMQDTKKEIFIVVTANRIQNIPSEFLRKGRLDEVWCVTFPTRKERKEILDIHLKNRGYNVKALDKVLDATEDYSSAELEYIVKESVLKASFKKQALNQEHMLAEVNNITPSCIAFRDDIERMKSWAQTHARMASEKEVKLGPDSKPKEI